MTTVVTGRIRVVPVADHWYRLEHRATGESLHMAGSVLEVLNVAARMHPALYEGRTFESAFWKAIEEVNA